MVTKHPSPMEIQLLALVVSERSGTEVTQLHAKESGTRISPGTLYTTFRRLREAGWVKVRDGADEDGRVRFFKITAAGSAALDRGREFYGGLSSFGLPPEGSHLAIGGHHHA